MNKGPLLAFAITGATAALVILGTLRPDTPAAALAGAASQLQSPTTAEAAVRNLAEEISRHAWPEAYASLGNKAQFSEADFENDLAGRHLSLRTYSTLDGYEVRALHASANEAEMELRLRWSTVVGTTVDTRDVHLTRVDNRWRADWPLVAELNVPPQVIPVTYLRWDVIYRGGGDDWAAQDVEAPHIRIVDMHPIERSDGVVVLGELLNEDVVPAYVTVKATLQGKGGTTVASNETFDKISHVLLPKQVTPFLISFPGATLSSVASIRMDPVSQLVPASADPVIEIQGQHFNPAPGAALVGELVNEGGQYVNVAHVLGTFYSKDGQLIWVADQYIDRALAPQQPVAFRISVPTDLARNVASERAVVATYIAGYR